MWYNKIKYYLFCCYGNFCLRADVCSKNMMQEKRKNSATRRPRRTRKKTWSRKIARKRKKKVTAVFVGFLILILGLTVWFGWNKMNSAQNMSPQESKKQTSSDQFPAGEVKVIRVIDGDTVEIEGGERVRYVGINSPEAANSQKQAECFSQEATEKNKSLVEGKTVRLEKDATDRDKYGRLLRYVYVGDTFVNLELVAQGFAHVRIYPMDNRYQRQLIDAQKEAKSSARGLWSACSGNK